MSGFAGLLGFLGALLLDCTFLFFDSIDAFDVCVEADLAIPGGSLAVGIVVMAAALGLLGYLWIPYLVDLRHEHHGMDETGRALVENVHRLPHEVEGPVERLLPKDDDGQADGDATEELSVDLRQTTSSDQPATSAVQPPTSGD